MVLSLARFAVIALRGSSVWNAAQVRSALTEAVSSYETVGGVGLQWHDLTSGSRTLSQWDGLIPLTVYVDGPTLWLARTPSLLNSALNHSSAAVAETGAYFARYNHQAELPSYLKVMRMLDLSEQQGNVNFFSENVGSLASSLDVIRSVSIRTTEGAQSQRQVIHL